MSASFSPYGFLRVAACTPELTVAAVEKNVSATVALLASAAQAGVQLAVFPELGLTGYTSGDLFFQDALLDAAWTALEAIGEACAIHRIAAAVGLPVRFRGCIYNCAAVFDSSGALAALVPKIFLPTNREFYEARWFASATRLTGGETLDFAGSPVPFGTDVLLSVKEQPSLLIGVEICEDLWTVIPPSSHQALAGGTVLLNLSASNELLGKAPYRRDLVKQQAARCMAAYIYSSAGPGESTSDVVYSGHNLIAENGRLLAESERLQFGSRFIAADLDIAQLAQERSNNSSFRQATSERTFRHVPVTLKEWSAGKALLRHVAAAPFVPSDPARRAANCREIFSLQTTALAKRLLHTRAKAITLGLSGGLDSTLAVLVAVQAFDQLGLPREGIVAISMPGLGTTERTKGNSEKLAEMLGLKLRSIPIGAAVLQHFADIGHPPDLFDITFENAQARERTQILMDIANQVGGFVLGTGDLSELALGWCTYNADHMSMYHVNAGVPKTLVRYLVEWCAEEVFQGPEAAVLHDIADTPISPELLPPDAAGDIAQKTEESVGPYALHDFFLFQILRHGSSPRKVYYLAQIAFAGTFPDEEILKWLRSFYRRFFSQQFKRNAMPDGPKIGSAALSPRGDWRMPSEAAADSWLAELENLNG
ncbi:MAG: putative synthetase [Akkermansiaceae bacterium]|nr:putative synthetase [Akkermansiaceae bacterium]